jgi:tetratricopeptide (TPR) repeat protein
MLANPGIEEKIAFKEAPLVSPVWPARLRALIPILGLGLAVIALVRFPSEYFAQRARAILSDPQTVESPQVAQAVGALVGRGLAFDRGNTELYYNLGEGHFMEGAFSADRSKSEEHILTAIAAYRNALKISPRDVRLWLCEATAFDALQRYADAEPLFVRALELDPNSANVQCAYAAHLFQQKRFAEAEAEYRKAEKLGSHTAEYWLQKIAEMQKAGQLGSANMQPPADHGDVSQNP